MSTTENPAHRAWFSFFCFIFSRGSALAEARFSSTNIEAYKTEVAVSYSNPYSLIPPKTGRCTKQMMVMNVPCHTYLRFKCCPCAAQFRGWCRSRLLFGLTGSSPPATIIWWCLPGMELPKAPSSWDTSSAGKGFKAQPYQCLWSVQTT